MPLFELTKESVTPLARTSMAQQSFDERADLQRLLKTSINSLGDDLLILAEEFSRWEDSKRRIDLLALGREGELVVIELKRTEDGGHMELQAIRYAAMVSTMTFQQAVESRAGFMSCTAEEAKSSILGFLGWEVQSDAFGKVVRILLVAPEFPKEITTTVLWLNDNGLNVRCVRIRPYLLNGTMILDVEQIIPLPEAEDYTIRVKEKQDENRLTNQAKWNVDFTRFDLTVNGKLYPNLWKRQLMWQLVKTAIESNVTVERLKQILGAAKFFEVDGVLSQRDFSAAAFEKMPVFDPKRFFTGDAHLIRLNGKTYALSNQWSIVSLPLADKIIEELPAGMASYSKSAPAE